MVDMPVLGLAGCHWRKIGKLQVRFHPHAVWSSLARTDSHGFLPPCNILKFYIYTHGTHTHTPHRSGADEMKTKVRWQWKWNLLNQDAKRGTQKKRVRENTNTTHLARNGQTLKRQGKRKAEADGQRNKTSGGGEDGSAWTNLTRRKPTPTSAREGPNLPVEWRTHEIGDPWGTS